MNSIAEGDSLDLSSYKSKKLECRLFQSLFDLTAADRGHVNAKCNLLILMRTLPYDLTLFLF